MFDFGLLRNRWNNANLHLGFDILEKFFTANPKIRTFGTACIFDQFKTNFDGIAETCVAIQCMCEDGLLKHQYAVEDDKGILIPELYDHVEDLPAKYGKLNLKMFIVVLRTTQEENNGD